MCERSFNGVQRILCSSQHRPSTEAWPHFWAPHHRIRPEACTQLHPVQHGGCPFDLTPCMTSSTLSIDPPDGFCFDSAGHRAHRLTLVREPNIRRGWSTTGLTYYYVPLVQAVRRQAQAPSRIHEACALCGVRKSTLLRHIVVREVAIPRISRFSSSNKRYHTKPTVGTHT